MSTKTKKSERTVSNKQILAHCGIGIGQNLTFTFWSSYITMFYTDVLGLALGSVTSLTLVARMWDALNDPLMGVVADRTRTKWGKFRPWLLFSAGPIALFLILSFTNPGFTSGGNLLYAWVTYLGMTTAFTLLDVPFWTMPAAYTENSDERTNILSKTRLTVTLTSLVAGFTLPPMIKYFGGQDKGKGFLGVAIMIALIGTAVRLIGFKTVREIPVNEHLEGTKREKFNFKKTMRVLTCNKPLMLVVAAGLLTNGFMTLGMNSQTYFAQYCLGDLSYMSILHLCALPGMVVGLLMVTAISKKVGKRNTFIGVNMILVVLNLLFYFIGYQNKTILFTILAVKAIPSGMNMVLISSMVADTIEYAEWKTGDRSEGLISSSQTFMSNVGLAIAGSFVPFFLGLAGYVPNVAQSASSLKMIFAMQSLLPAIGFALGTIPMFFYTLTEKRHAEIVEELRLRKQGNSEEQ